MKIKMSILIQLLVGSLYGQENGDSLNSITNTSDTSISWLVYIIIFVILVSLFIIYKRYNKPKNIINVPDDWKKPKKEHDFDDVFKGVSGKSQILYKKLIRKCHPDRFIGDENKILKATTLSSLITNNKHNYSKLKELQIKATEVLGINWESEKETT